MADFLNLPSIKTSGIVTWQGLKSDTYFKTCQCCQTSTPFISLTAKWVINQQTSLGPTLMFFPSLQPRFFRTVSWGWIIEPIPRGWKSIVQVDGWKAHVLKSNRLPERIPWVASGYIYIYTYYIYICKCAHMIFIYTHVYVHIYIYIYTCICTHYIYIHVYVHIIYIHMYMYISHLYTCRCTYIYMEI